MKEVNVTEFRRKLPAYLKTVEKGRKLRITSRGRVVAHLVPPDDATEAARAQLSALRKTAHVDDVLAPTGERWRASH